MTSPGRRLLDATDVLETAISDFDGGLAHDAVRARATLATLLLELDEAGGAHRIAEEAWRAATVLGAERDVGVAARLLGAPST